MQSEILYGPSCSFAVLSLANGETIQAESGAMVSMTEGIDMQTSTKGGVLKGMKRAVLGGESLFINTFTAERDAEITMAPAFPGASGSCAYSRRRSTSNPAPTLSLDGRHRHRHQVERGEDVLLW